MFFDAYKYVMDNRYNLLFHTQGITTIHLVMQALAWMWYVIFSMRMGSIFVFGVSAIVLALLIAGVFAIIPTLKLRDVDPCNLAG